MQLFRWSKVTRAIMAAGAVSLAAAGWTAADVQPGETITKENMDKVADLLTPSMKWFVEHGMPIKVVPYKKIQWPHEGYPAKPLSGGKYNYEDEWPFDPNGMMMDVQTAHASKWDAPSGYVKPSDWVNEWYFNEAVPINTEQAFSINYLIQSAR